MTVLDTGIPLSSTRRRVLPWRRQQTDVALAPLIAAHRTHFPKPNTGAIEAAFQLARAAHDGQVRRSGEAYLTHPIGVALILANLGLDDVAICAALLHDAVEDTAVTLEDIDREVGSDVAQLVDGVTKLDRMLFASREEQQAATVRKLVLAMARDVRVLLLKLADRLHNMKTLASLPESKQVRIATETMDVYAPLAHRLGVGELKWQLEDLSFAVLHPKRYAEIESMVTAKVPRRAEDVNNVIGDITTRLAAAGIKVEVSGRQKHYWSIYEKMVVKERDFDEVWDLIGVRVTVESVKDCYAALGTIHAMWTPISGRFKDYIATPKFNLYQSLHTTVVDTAGRVVELQIRTEDMNRRAEYGIAAHWQYKSEGSEVPDAPWVKRLLDTEESSDTPTQFLEQLKGDLQSDEVAVFTPKGRLVSLLAGATPVDFAYAIHTEIGNRCIGAKVNGRLVPLEMLLTAGDTVEIFTSKMDHAGPNEDWLQFLVTPRARAKVRQWFSRERRGEVPELGEERVARALRDSGLPVEQLLHSAEMERVAVAMQFEDASALTEAVGAGVVPAKKVVQRLQSMLQDGDQQLPVSVARPPRRERRNAGVHVEGFNDVLIRLSKCCTPVPPDPIVGFMTRGRGVSVHREDCENAHTLLASSSDRLVEAEWDRDHASGYVVRIEIEAIDRQHLLTEITAAIADLHVSIHSCRAQTTPDRIARLTFEFELSDPSHLESILMNVRQIRGVYEARRL